MPEWTDEIRTRLAGLRLSPEREAEIIEELSQHLEQRYEDLRDAGETEAEARRKAIDELLETDALANHMRSLRQAHVSTPIAPGAPSDSLLDGFWQDLRYAVRSMCKRPAFFLSAILILAIGIGMNTVVFSIIKAVLLNPLPYPKPDELVMIWSQRPSEGTQSGVSSGDFVDIRQRFSSASDVAGLTYGGGDIVDAAEPYLVTAARVSASFFKMLKIEPLLGRNFVPEDDSAATAPVVILTHRLWQERFGADPNVIGSALNLFGNVHTIVGVLRPEFISPCCGQFDLYMSLEFTDAQRNARGGGYTTLMARLKPGTSLATAKAEMTTITAQFAREQPSYTDRRLRLVPLHEQLVGNVRLVLFTLWAAVLATLLIACANLANLLLTRATAREKELAVRASLGASRWRLVRQLLTESLMLALFGGALAMALAWTAIRVVPTIEFTGLPRLNEVGIDTGVLGFGLVLTVLTGLLVGTVPAWRITRVDTQFQLQESGRGTSGRRTNLVRSSLVVAQISVALILLAAAGLLIRSFFVLQDVDTGFATKNVLTFNLSLPAKKYMEKDAPGYFQEVREKIASLPQVASVAGITFVPPSGFPFSWGYDIEGKEPANRGSQPIAEYRVVTPGFFSTIGIPLIAGRDFELRDTAGTPLVSIVSESFARLNWPGEDAIGKRYRRGVARPLVFTVIGVVGDARLVRLDQAPGPAIYETLSQVPSLRMNMVVRSETEPLTLARSIQAEVREVNRDALFSNLRPLELAVSRSLGQRRLLMILHCAFAGMALLLAMLSVYSVISHAVAQRTPEIGIRMALGARSSDIMRAILKQGVILTISGIALGLAGALFLSNLMASLLYGIDPADTLTIIAVSIVLFFVALTATYVPARRALGIDPLVAMRRE
jgi:putative ABC transport system permease protein